MIQVKLEWINTIYVFSVVCISIYTLIISEYDPKYIYEYNIYFNIFLKIIKKDPILFSLSV